MCFCCLCVLCRQMWSAGDIEDKVSCALDSITRGAAVISEAGNAVYTMSHAMQERGLSGLLQQELWKKERAPVSNPKPTRVQPSRKSTPQLVPQNVDEKRALLHVRLEKAMQEQDMSHVQQLSRELDELDGVSNETAHTVHKAGHETRPAVVQINSNPTRPNQQGNLPDCSPDVSAPVNHQTAYSCFPGCSCCSHAHNPQPYYCCARSNDASLPPLTRCPYVRCPLTVHAYPAYAYVDEDGRPEHFLAARRHGARSGLR